MPQGDRQDGKAPDASAKGSNAWVALKNQDWPERWKAIQAVMLPELTKQSPNLRTLEEARELAELECEWAMKRWPHVTTEAMATDRVYWIGMGNATRLMTASGIAGPDMLATYRGLGREFAAVVLNAMASSLRVAVYNLSDETKRAAVVPWLLDSGAKYECRIGPDRDNDGQMDEIAEKNIVLLENRGQEFPFRIESREQLVIEIVRVSDFQGRALFPDLALSSEDVAYNASMRTVEVSVHNIGGARAKGVSVILLDGEREIGRTRIPNIEAPLDLDPKIVRVGFRFEPSSTSHALTAVVELENGKPEITKVNNKVTLKVDTPDVHRFRHGGA